MNSLLFFVYYVNYIIITNHKTSPTPTPVHANEYQASGSLQRVSPARRGVRGSRPTVGLPPREPLSTSTNKDTLPCLALSIFAEYCYLWSTQKPLQRHCTELAHLFIYNCTIRRHTRELSKTVRFLRHRESVWVFSGFSDNKYWSVYEWLTSYSPGL